MTDETLPADQDDPPYFDDTPPEKDPETQPSAPGGVKFPGDKLPDDGEGEAPAGMQP